MDDQAVQRSRRDGRVRVSSHPGAAFQLCIYLSLGPHPWASQVPVLNLAGMSSLAMESWGQHRTLSVRQAEA